MAASITTNGPGAAWLGAPCSAQTGAVPLALISPSNTLMSEDGAAREPLRHLVWLFTTNLGSEDTYKLTFMWYYFYLMTSYDLQGALALQSGSLRLNDRLV
ncbi:hypothetical protein EYF80_046127 [Liparis tanakae]|uniref:Uncharacterized protein n=1 Tax=Liparis tanakae TaxID=230148 RepID=A0A4Z2FSJ3_9TELE|nr:hypothetical protein EYF80_046127 [Liparis tanakae]